VFNAKDNMKKSYKVRIMRRVINFNDQELLVTIAALAFKMDCLIELRYLGVTEIFAPQLAVS